MRPLEQQTILVTGATAGLGLGLASELAKRGARVLLHGRSEERIEAAIAEIAGQSGRDRLVGYRADFSSLQEVRVLAEAVARRGRLDALVNNAGVAPQQRRESRDGYELTFAVNYLASFILTNLLLSTLRDSAPSRIVNVASLGQAAVNFDDVMLERRYEMSLAYGQSKLAMIAFTFELAERLREAGETEVSATALHPATLMPTKLVHQSYGRTVDSLEQGVEATLRLVSAPELEGVSGVFFNGLDEAAAEGQAYDADARRRLWELSESITGVRWARG